MTTATDGHAISLQNVTKIYRRKIHALRGINMQVKRGEIFGLLGPNGAGKSTLVKIMMSVVRPTRAEGLILNRPIGHKPTLRQIGYLPENHRFPKYLTGRQVIEFFAALCGVDRSTRRKRAGELLELVGMTNWGNAKISQYSKGMLQRIGLAQAMGADPELIVLDEPTDGVDPAGRRDIRKALLELRARGKTIFINSHLLSELESVCDRVAILVQGAVARQGTIDELTVAKQCFLFEVSPVENLPGLVNAALGGVLNLQVPPPFRGKLADATWCELDGVFLRLGRTDPAAVQDVLDALRRQGLVIRRMHLVRPSLEELFFEAVANTALGAGAA
jgi:ABC-2 type transport system ATP-binding protein